MIRQFLAGMFIVLLASAAIFIVFLAQPGHSQTVREMTEIECAPHGQLVAGLTGGYGEVLFAVGTIYDKKMETYVNPETKTWTVVVVRPDGTACMLASGDSFSGAPNA